MENQNKKEISNKQESMLKLVKIRKEYIVAGNPVVALKEIDLEFRKNEFVSILGPSGCGKTTMLNLIGGLDKYTTGDLIINGTSTSEFKDAEWDAYRNNSIGFVFQSYNLIPHLNILGNVELALTLSGISRDERTKRATEVLVKVGLQDHITKKPNQLSGGQMQRVAIARALINNPDIILADEPTGALDTETSVQIMELLKEVAKEKLVIMVTHNPELAQEYSTRIVSFKDGAVVSDTNPMKETVIQEAKFTPKKTSMPFKMALSLSLKNLISKKGRTIITAIAGSIGIIGIAMVLALSTGFQGYVDDMQAQLTTEYPLTLTQYTFDMETAFAALDDLNSTTKYPDNDKLTSSDIDISTIMHVNIFTDEFIEYIMKLNPDLYNELLVTYAVNLNILSENNMGGYNKVDTKDLTGNFMTEMMGMTSDPWAQILNDTDFMLTQYDLIYGDLPTNKNEVVLFVDEYNSIDKSTLENLGIYGNDIDFANVIGHEFSLITNDKYYQYDDVYSKFAESTLNSSLYDDGEKLKISGILRINPKAAASSLTCTIGYTEELAKWLIDYETSDDTMSDIVKYINNFANSGKNPFTGTYYEGLFNEDFSLNEDFDYTSMYTNSDFSAVESPSKFSFYAKTLEGKEKIKDYIQGYNNLLTEDQIEAGLTIKYFDNVEMMVGSLNTMISAISAVLIAFTSISLVVSSVMIGIITYVSVIERTKEIGVLRSIGARKKDISRVFNAETLIIGFFAGFFAVTFTYIISIPINIVVESLLEVTNISRLSPIAAIILILISMSLTLIAGLIPSSVAAKKDPVTALRSE